MKSQTPPKSSNEYWLWSLFEKLNKSLNKTAQPFLNDLMFCVQKKTWGGESVSKVDRMLLNISCK